MATAKDTSGNAITFSRGAQATAEGVANAAKNGIINNVQTSGGRAVKGSTLRGQDVSGQSITAPSDEVANITKEAADFKAFMESNALNQQPATPTTPYQSKSFVQKAPNDPTVFNDKNEALSYDQYIAQGGKADFSNVQKAFQQATESGTPPPQTPGEAKTAMDQMTPPQTPQTPAEVDSFLQTSPIMQSSIQELQEFLSPESTTKMLQDSMKQIIKDQKAAAQLKFELMDVDRVMAGTEQDIRDEVEATNGFATESQVQALTIGRNKVLLQKAAMIQNKLNYMQDVIQSDMMMYGFQKDMAQQEFQKRSFLLQFKQENDRFIYQANQDALNRQLTIMGADGMYNATGGDPVKIDRLERMMGLQPGGLKQAADTAIKAKAEAKAQQDLENKQRQQQINISAGNLALSRQQFAWDQQMDLAKLPLPGQVSPETLSKLQSSSEYKAIGAILPAIQSIAQFKSLVAKEGSWAFGGEARGKLDAAYGNAIAQWKTLAGLGALSGADFALAENAIPSLGMFKRNDKIQGQLSGSLDNAVSQAKSLTQRLSQLYPDAALVLNEQLDDILVTAYPNQYKQGPDGKVYEIK